MTCEREQHWNTVYAEKLDTEVSWFEQSPETSLALIRVTGVAKDAGIIDVGGGSSRLVDRLLEKGCNDISILDLSERALSVAKARLRERAETVQWIVADVTTWHPGRAYDLWHDRAAFHFLTEPDDRRAYVETLARALRPGGHVIIGTFALGGPERCSGLPIVRYSAATLANELGTSFKLVDTRDHEHHTPARRVQRFQFSRFIRAC
jgi:SAM-dependent methyltransferase